MIRPLAPEDEAAALAMSEASGLFDAHELEEVAVALASYLNGELGEGHSWIVDDDDGR